MMKKIKAAFKVWLDEFVKIAELEARAKSGYWM